MNCSRTARKWAASSSQAAIWLVALALALPLLSAPSRAQEPPSASAVLASIEVTGSARFPSDRIVAATELRTGASVTREELQAAADRLERLGPFATVQYRYTTGESGVNVAYQVTDAPEIPVVFDNFPWFTDEELMTSLERSVPLFNGMAPENGAVLDDMASAIERLLDMRDVHASVSHQVTVRGAAGQRVQQFSADGVDLGIERIEFSDPLANSDRGVQDQLTNLIGKPYSRSVIELFELEQVRPVYLSHAFLRVQFPQPAARFADAKNSQGKVVVAAPINPGPAYIWNGVTWKGNYSIPPDALDDLVKLHTGDPADGMKIQAAWESVRGLYGERGFLDAKVVPAPEFNDAAKRISYAVSIDEGTQYHMGDLVLTGLSPDGERRIRAAWKLSPGSVFDKTLYDEFLDTGIKQAFAGLPYRYDKIGRFLQEDSKDSKVDVLLDFQ